MSCNLFINHNNVAETLCKDTVYVIMYSNFYKDVSYAWELNVLQKHIKDPLNCLYSVVISLQDWLFIPSFS